MPSSTLQNLPSRPLLLSPLSKLPQLQNKPSLKPSRQLVKKCDRLYIFTATFIHLFVSYNCRNRSCNTDLELILTYSLLSKEKTQNRKQIKETEAFSNQRSRLIRIKYRFLLIMIKIFSRHPFRAFRRPLIHNKRFYNFANDVKILRDSDEISLADIDKILGNISTQLQEKKQEEKQIQKRQLFYGLVPIKNQHFPPCIDPDFVELIETPNQNIMQAININVESSFKDYCTGMTNFWREDELYGSITPETKIEPQSIEFLPVLTVDSKYLERVRKEFLVNLSIPGSIEAEDPRNFMELRPIQEFRNTPIIPIAESTMKKHKEKLEQYHRRQMVLQISKESIINFVLFATAIGICGYMIYILLEKEEERTVAYTRLKYNRRMGIQETPTFRI